MAFHCRHLKAIISCLMLLNCVCACVDSRGDGDDCDLSVAVLPTHQTDCWGLGGIEDTLVCYAFEKRHDSLYRVSFYHSTDDGDSWSSSGVLDFDSFTEILGFNVSNREASLTVGEYNQDYSSYRHRIYVSSDGCRNWNLVKEGLGRIQGTCLYNDSTISILQADSLSYQVLLSEDIGKHWSSVRRDSPIKYPHQIVLDNANAVCFDYQTVTRQSILAGTIDTIFISDKKYGVTNVVARENAFAINEEWKDIVLIHKSDSLRFETRHWKSHSIFPIYINAQDSILYLTVRDMSMNNPQIGTFAILDNGERIIPICSSRIDYVSGNKVYAIFKDPTSQTYKLQRFTLFNS